jgi:hypothetical protein
MRNLDQLCGWFSLPGAGKDSNPDKSEKTHQGTPAYRPMASKEAQRIPEDNLGEADN